MLQENEMEFQWTCQGWIGSQKNHRITEQNNLCDKAT